MSSGWGTKTPRATRGVTKKKKGAVCIPILWKPRLRETQRFTRGLPAGRWESWELNLSLRVALVQWLRNSGGGPGSERVMRPRDCDMSRVARPLHSAFRKNREKAPPQLGCDMLSEVELQNEISSTPALLGVQNQARGVSDAQLALEEL